MTTKPIPSMSSEELYQHLKQLRSDMSDVQIRLSIKNQTESAEQIQDAYDGLRKAIACWNHAITW